MDPAVLEAQLDPVPVERGARADRLRELFRASGCLPPRLRDQRALWSALPNVLCELPGATDRTIVVGGHYDRARYGRGVLDNWTGVAMLPALYRSLSAQPRHHTFLFAGFTKGAFRRRGSEYFVRRVVQTGRPRVVAMVNLKALGLGSAAVWQDHADPNLWLDLRSVAGSLGVPLRTVNVPHRVPGAFMPQWYRWPWPIYADSESFRKRGIPAILVTSFDRGNFRIITESHRDDTTENVRRDAYFSAYRLVATYLGYLDSSLEERRRRYATR